MKKKKFHIQKSLIFIVINYYCIWTSDQFYYYNGEINSNEWKLKHNNNYSEKRKIQTRY